MTAVSYTTAHTRSTKLDGIRLVLARLAWAAIAVICLLLLVLNAPKNPHLLMFEPVVEDSYALLAEMMTYQAYLDYIVFMRYLVMGIFYVTAVFIFWRRSDDWLALLTSISLISLPYLILFSGNLYTTYDEFKHAFWLMIADASLAAAGFLSIPVLLFVFPDGRLEPQRLQKLIKGLLAIVVLLVLLPFGNDFIFLGVNWAEIIFFILLIDFLLLILLGCFGQIYRYLRASTTGQRQQTKWIVFAILINIVWWIFVTVRADTLRFTAAAIYGLFELHASLIIVAFIPISFAVSILRYRLYDIDLIVRRTLIYGSISVLLGLTYLASITLLQSLFTSLVKQESQISIVLSTLAIIALFNPLRKRVQTFIDRRFYRRKYNAEQALMKFAQITREEVEVERLANELLLAVQETMEPAHVDLWMGIQDIQHQIHDGKQT